MITTLNFTENEAKEFLDYIKYLDELEVNVQMWGDEATLLVQKNLGKVIYQVYKRNHETA